MSDLTEFEKEFEGDEIVADLVTLVTGQGTEFWAVDLDAEHDQDWYWRNFFSDTPPRPDLGAFGEQL